MTHTSEYISQPTHFTKRQKHFVEKDFRTRIEGTGGTYIGINWKKLKVHFLTPTGKRGSKIIDFQMQK
jgi:hypothetical protein